MITEKFEKEKYSPVEFFASAKKANLLVCVVVLPICAIEAGIYLLQRDYANIFATIFKTTFLLEILILAFGMFLFVAAAMITKAALLSSFSEGKFASVKFKIIGNSQKPHCCLTEPIKVWQYRICLGAYIAVAMVIPYAISLFTGDFIFVIASMLCAFFATGDVLFLFALFWRDADSYILDFEGFLLYRIYEKHE
ncbi:MAG: hypothetical protein FWG34_05665 [Oscillospiraceae bacterium]|nr:hypothetical protein [Oscillospiraceae bacterium]